MARACAKDALGMNPDDMEMKSVYLNATRYLAAAVYNKEGARRASTLFNEVREGIDRFQYLTSEGEPFSAEEQSPWKAYLHAS